MDTLILFPGLGASEKLFAQYDFGNKKSYVVEFLVPEKNESLHQYSLRIVQTIPFKENLIFIGVSFGGILAQEISKILPAKKIILISTIKSEREKPRYFLFWRWLPVYWILPATFMKRIIIQISKLLTRKTKEEQKLLSTLVKEADIRVIKWGIYQTLHWEQQKILSNLIHIHGDADFIFPVKRINADFIIEGGSHFMIIQHCGEINRLINRLIS